eukprot:TRINITY_DN47479_c0_g1_i2.p2 TRINITY_DN47479_c0_g1~~TRINITY_DN47479_c0_g1_i2.p2  ORF type:complete len:249 (-),score=48.73 TRINITY_DN47479_c0_g1_i2:1276-2022(-)
MFSAALDSIKRPAEAGVESERKRSKETSGAAGSNAASSKPPVTVASDKVPELVTALAEWSLVLGRKVGVLASVVTLVCLFSKELGKPLIQLYRETTTRYDATLKAMSPVEREGSFSVLLYLWLAFIEAPPLKDAPEVVEHKKQLEKEVTEWRSSLKEADRQDEKSTLMLMLGQHVKTFRLSTCHLASQMRWEVIAVGHAAPVAQLFMKHLCVECKGVMKPGSAPKGRLERKIETMIGRGKGRGKGSGK